MKTLYNYTKRGVYMSTQRFQIDQVDFNKALPKAFIYNRTKFDHEWNSTLHTHLYTEMFYDDKRFMDY